jgi:glycyl-tRNA synthetase alpha chain
MSSGAPSFQDLVLGLERYWAERGCVIAQPYPSEVGAGTFNPATFLRALGPEPWNGAYVEPSRRPMDGRAGENPMRFQQFYQYQVILKPSPDDVLDLYFGSLAAAGLKLDEHDLRLVEDDWESPTLGAWGLGWQVWMDGMEITQFTYFQQVGGIDLDPISAEITYGLDRIAMMLQGVDRVQDVRYAGQLTWADLWLQNEKEFCRYNTEEANVEMLRRQFQEWESEATRLLGEGLVFPGYDAVVKTSHLFNLLEARGAISVSERVGIIGRIRKLARQAARAYLNSREEQGYPWLSAEEKTRLGLDKPKEKPAPKKPKLAEAAR